MKTIRTGLYPVGRLEAGAIILAAARAVDTSLVNKRLEVFTQAHRTYEEAQRAVEAAELQLQALRAKLTEFDAKQNEALDDMAAALSGDKQPRQNPFVAFGVDAPSTVEQLSYGEKAKALHKLSAAVLLRSGLSKATYRAAQAAAEAARRMEIELSPVNDMQATLNTARVVRDDAGKAWDGALAALKLAARAAAPDGAPGLYRALFGRSRPKRKPAEASPVAAQPAAAVGPAPHA